MQSNNWKVTILGTDREYDAGFYQVSNALYTEHDERELIMLPSHTELMEPRRFFKGVTMEPRRVTKICLMLRANCVYFT